jgi:hypothetical protein
MSRTPGTRCRLTRTVICPGGIVRRGGEGTLVSLRENLGRLLFTVDFGGGRKIVLFAHEFETEGGPGHEGTLSPCPSGIARRGPLPSSLRSAALRAEKYLGSFSY